MSELPNSWLEVPLSDLTSSIANGFTHQNNPTSGGVPLSRIQTISRGEIDFDLVGYAGLGDESVAKYLLNPGDILFSHINSKEHVGKVAIYKDGMPPLVHGMNLLRIVASETVIPEYLFWSLRSDFVKNQIWDNTRHAVNQASINIRNLSTVKIPVAPLDEQRRIVKTLDDHLSRLDKALAELDHADSQTLVFRRSILNAMLNPNVSDSKPGVEPMMIPPGWKTVSLGALVDVLDSKRIPLSAAERKHREGSVPYYGATGQVGTIDKPLFDEPLVLLGEDGVQFFDPYKPKAYKIAGPSWVNNHAHVLRPKAESIEFGYLLHYLNAFDYQGYANGTTRLKLTQGAMNSIPIHLPPLHEQRRIVETLDDHLSRLDTTRKSIADQKSWFATLRRSILNKAFIGDLGTN